MTKNYNQYIEEVKKKLDAMNKAAGIDPQAIKQAQQHTQNPTMPPNDVFDMIGNGAKIWMEKNKKI